jgi:snRNA-activating protein complex subunit 1
LSKLRNLVAEAKTFNIQMVPDLVKRILERNMFLFGFVDTLGGTARSSDDNITRQLNRQLEEVSDKYSFFFIIIINIFLSFLVTK